MKKQLPILFLFAVSHVMGQSTLISQFDFNGNHSDNLSNGTCISYLNSSTMFGAGSFQWSYDSTGAGGGLRITLPDAIFTEDNYSIAIDFQFAETSGYRKIVDFKSRNSDQGVYVNDQLRLYSIGGYGATTINADSNFTILLTRDGLNDSTKLYLYDGVNMLLQSNGADVSSDFVADLMSSDRVIHFFTDDSVTVSEYSLGGMVNQIRIWNGVATISDLLDIQEPSEGLSFVVYPNPAMDQVQIDFENPTSGIIEIYTLQGQMMQQLTLNNESKVELDVQGFAPGVYIIRHKGSSFRLVK